MGPLGAFSVKWNRAGEELRSKLVGHGMARKSFAVGPGISQSRDFSEAGEDPCLGTGSRRVSVR